MRPVTLNPHNVTAALAEIDRASHENDLAEIAQNFKIGNAPAAQRAFNGSSVQLSTTGIGNGADATEDTLFSYSLPAGALAIAGEGLSLFAFGSLANNAHNKTVKLYFGATVFSLGTVSTAAASWWAKATVYKVSSSHQLVVFDGMIGATAIATSVVASTETDTAAIVIKVTGQSGSSAANDVVANGLTASGTVADLADAFATFISDCQKGGMNRTT